MPRWRAAIVPAARCPAGSAPASARPVSPGSASAIPTPMNTCGTSVHAGSAPGTRPSAARPPASTIAPAAITAVVCASPRVSRRAAIVATGIAETITAAASGE